jgi:hypothetical protein
MLVGLGLGRRLAATAAVALACGAMPAIATAGTLPLPANAGTTPDATVNSISCPAAGDCSAVGYYTDDGGNTELLLLSQHDGNWSPTEGDISALAGATGGIEATHADLSATSVSCGDPGDCSVIGGYQDGTSDFHFRGFVLTESGGVWGAAQPVVLPVNADTSATFEPYTNLDSISCGSAGDCSAVGTYRATSAGNVEGLQLLQTNGTWSAATEAALPSSGATAAAADPDVYLPSVSCGATGICLAFGDYSLLSGGNAGLVLSDNGGSWTVSAVQPTGLADASHSPAYLQLGDWSSGGDYGSVACPAQGLCVAAATYEDQNSDYQGLLLSQSSPWSQSTIDLTKLSDQADANPQVNLGSVACVSPGDCTILGSYSDHKLETQGLLVTDAGGLWTPATTVELPSDQSSVDPAVSSSSLACAAVGNCAGVIYYEDNAGNPTSELLSESAGKWSTNELATPTPSTDIPPYYDWGDVACSPSGYCSAVTNTELNSGTSAASALTVISPPGQFVTLSATGGADQATVNWDPPASISDLPITGYTVIANDLTTAANGGNTWKESSSTSSVTFTGLTPGNTYDFSVIPSNALGSGLPSTTGAIDVIPSHAQLLAALRAVLVPTGPKARLKAILKARGFSFTFLPPWGGRLAISWYYRYGARKHRHRTLVAKFALNVAGQHSIAVKVTLTRAGRRLLEPHRRLKRHRLRESHRQIRLTTDAAYTANAVARVTLSKSFSLR